MPARFSGLKTRFSAPLALTVLSWGFNFVALKVLYLQMSPPAVSVVRFLPMWGILAGLCVWKRESLRYPREEVLRLLALGALSMGLYMVLFLEGMRRTSAAEGAIILATAPIFTALLAAATKQERFRWSVLVGTSTAFLGVALVVLGADGKVHGQLLGNALILASAVVWAGCAVLTKTLVGSMSPLRVLTLSMPGGLVVLIPYGFGAALGVDWGHLDLLSWAMFAHVTILAGVVGFTGFYAGVRQIGSSGAMLYQYLVPPLAVFFAWLMLGDPLHPLQGVGLAVILSGVIYTTRARQGL